MSFNKKFFTTGGIVASSEAVCNTDSKYAFGADSSFTSNVATYQLDGNANDTTGNYNGTATNVTFSSTGAYLGQAASFNGSSSKIELPNSSLGITDSSNFSISYWFNTNSTTQDNQSVIWANGSNAGARFGSGINSPSQGGDTSVYFGMPVNGSFTYINSGTSAFTANTWVHVVCVKSSTTGMSLYVDNVLKATNTGATGSGSATATGKNSIGMYHTSSDSSFFNGKIDQVRIFNREINASEVATLYAETTSTASSINPLNEGQGVALYNLDYDASDAGGLYDGTPSNVTFGVGGNIKYGARFNGSSSYIDLPNLGTDLSGSNTRTLSAWVNLDANPSVYYAVVSYGTTANLESFGLYISSSGTPRVSYYNLNWDTSTALTIGSWHHIVGIYKGGNVETSTNTELYIDGVKQTITKTGSLTGSANTSNSNYAIGYYKASPTSSYFDGDIDQVRIFSSVLNQTQVSTLHAEEACVYDATTTNNYYPLADGSSDAVAYYKLDNSAEDSVSTNDGTETDIEYRFGRYGQAAVFNGSSSYIDTGVGGSVLGTLFSVSVWFKTSTTSTYQTILDNGGNTSDHEGFALVVGTDNILKARFGDGNGNALYDVSTNITVADGIWHHCVLTYNNESIKIYVDNGTPATGTNTATPSSSPTFTQADFNLRIGAYVSNGLAFNGNIDQIRVFSSELDSDQVSQLYNEKPETDTSNFKTVLYEGDGGSQYISNVGIDLETNGGLVWLKNRSEAYNHQVYDSVRGAGNSSFSKSLVTNNNQAESWSSSTNGYLSSFDANGFSLTQGGTNADAVNRNNNDYVAWVWKGGGDAVSGTGSGVTNVSVSANTDAGFSIVKFTGVSGSNQTVEHGLNSEPEIYFLKGLDNGTDSWIVCGNSTIFSSPTTNYLRLNTTNSVNSTTSGSVGSNGDDINVGVRTYAGLDTIAYCWHSVSGYSKIGTFTGDSSSNKFIDVGFKPSWVMLKNTETAYRWYMLDSVRDPSNPAYKRLFANDSVVEATNGTFLNFESTGFRLITSDAEINQSGKKILYMAFK